MSNGGIKGSISSRQVISMQPKRSSKSLCSHNLICQTASTVWAWSMKKGGIGPKLKPSWEKPFQKPKVWSKLDTWMPHGSIPSVPTWTES